MKKWQVAAVGAVLAIGAAGIATASFADVPAADSSIVVPPGHVVVVNGGWAPAGGSYQRPAVAAKAPSLPPASGAVLFSADFSQADSSAWTSPLLQNVDVAPLWLIQNGTVQIAGTADLSTPAEEAYYFAGQPTWQNVIFEASVLASSGEGAGVVWNAQGDSYYRVQLFPNLPNTAAKASLELVQHGQATVLARSAPAAYAGYRPDVWQQLRIQSTAGRQQVWVNGTLLFDVSNSTLTSGQVGLFAWADSGTRFDNVRVQSAGSGR